MSVAVLWEFTCDHCGDDVIIVIDGARSTAAAWREAKAKGWSEWLNGYKGHWCPWHRQPRTHNSREQTDA